MELKVVQRRMKKIKGWRKLMEKGNESRHMEWWKTPR